MTWQVIWEKRAAEALRRLDATTAALIGGTTSSVGQPVVTPPAALAGRPTLRRKD